MTTDSLQPDALWTPFALLPDGWRRDVYLTVGADGRWASVEPDTATPPVGAEVVEGALLPGVVNAHSHAFQRAFVGLTEPPDGEPDDFWSWRTRMYAVANRLTPDILRAVAAQLYLELLEGGYTHVCEFHYVHRDVGGKPYADRTTMPAALVEAADEVGIGLTLLPTVYERAGFGRLDILPEQRRFFATPDDVWATATALEEGRSIRFTVGLALHSVRAVRLESFDRLRRIAENFTGPIHIHVAEQTAEVEACLLETGARPVAWLTREGLLDPRWQLVHATHTDEAERAAVAQSGAGIVVCPTTEANLGDGLFDLPAWTATGVPLAVGSDSHVTRDWREELRWLTYGARLATRRRGLGVSASTLFTGAQSGGGDAAGEPVWGLMPGARADALRLDLKQPPLVGVPLEQWIDAVVFSSPGALWADVMVAGRWALRRGRHPCRARILARFQEAMNQLWRDETRAVTSGQV
ncbi:MAG: formimidoylglutamate deiminase [Chloracidobacterium sp.]|nr:formimidoylglutamate deiminase [Chloracidobacterium sp.]MDW8218684.1 formimidoylglutamate deiminase [Acidobacteriota bacterium]